MDAQQASQKEAFRRYLESAGVVDALTKGAAAASCCLCARTLLPLPSVAARPLIAKAPPLPSL